MGKGYDSGINKIEDNLQCQLLKYAIDIYRRWFKISKNTI